MNDILTITVRDDRKDAAARSMLYAGFARLFSYPSDELAACILDGTLFEEICESAADLPYPSSLRACCWPSLPESPAVLQSCYWSLFQTASPAGAVVSLNEKDYVRTDRNQLWEDILRFYDHFGIEYSADRVEEFPDHLVTQLEFLHYLAFLEAGTAGDADPYIRARGDFVERHLANWLPALADKLALKAADAPYAGFGELLRLFLAEEERYRMQHPADRK